MYNSRLFGFRFNITSDSNEQSKQDSYNIETTQNCTYISPSGLNDVNLLAQLEIGFTLKSEHDQWKQFVQQYPQYSENKSVFLQARAYQQLAHHFNARFLIDSPYQSESVGNKQLRTRLQCINCHFKSEELPCYRFIQQNYKCPQCTNEDKEDSSEEPEGSSNKRRKADNIHGVDGKWYTLTDYIELIENKLNELYREKFQVINISRSKPGGRFQGTIQCLSCSAELSGAITSLLHKRMECKQCTENTSQISADSSETAAAILASSLHALQ